MPNPPAPLEERIAALEGRLADLASRLEALEGPRAGARGTPASAPADAPAIAAAATARPDEPDARSAAPAALALDAMAPPAGAVPAPDGEAPDAADADGADEGEPPAWQAGALRVGGTFLVLAGAFLLRALTEAQTLSEPLGIGLGLAWAATWALVAHRAGRAGRPADASFHGVSSLLVAFPLIWEASTRFGALGPLAGSGLLALFALGILGTAWHNGLRALAFVAALAASVASVALVFPTKDPAPLALVLLPLGLASLAAGWHREWDELAWPAALAADAIVALLGARAGTPAYAWLGTGALLGLQAALVFLYLGAFGLRTLAFGRSVGVFEILQALLVLAAGFEGAVSVAGGEAPGRWILAALAGSAAVGAFAATFRVLERREETAWNVPCCTALGSVLALEALRLALPLPLAGLAWTALALGLAFPAARVDRVALRASVAVLAVAGTLASGLLPDALGALAGRSVPPGAPEGEALGSLALAAGTLFVLRRRRAPDGRRPAWTVPCLALVLSAGTGMAGAVAGALGGTVAGFGEGADLGLLAVLRTSVLAALTLLLAALGRRRDHAEFRWATRLALAAMAVKVLAEDVPRGRPLTLFVTLAIFGGALMAASRIVRRRGPPRPGVTTP